MIKLYYWLFSHPASVGEDYNYYSGYSPNLSELDIPDYAEVTTGMFFSDYELTQQAAQLQKTIEERERKAFEAGAERKQIDNFIHWTEAEKHCPGYKVIDEKVEYINFQRTQTFDDYLRARKEGKK